MEQLNIEGKRSGEGFVCHRERLVSALSRAQAPKVRINDIELGRKGFLGYIRLLSGGMVKITPSNGGASEAQATGKGLRIVCGSNASYLENGAWITEKMAIADSCEVRVSPNTSVIPNLGGLELAEALARVIPFAAGKKDERPVLQCIRFAQKEGKLTLASADGYRLADVSLDFEDGEGNALVPAYEIKGRTLEVLLSEIIVSVEGFRPIWEPGHRLKFPVAGKVGTDVDVFVQRNELALLVSCKSYGVNREYELGNGQTWWDRSGDAKSWLRFAHQTAEVVAEHHKELKLPKELKGILPLVCTGWPEYLFEPSEDYFFDDGTPRIATLREIEQLCRSIDDTKAKKLLEDPWTVPMPDDS